MKVCNPFLIVTKALAADKTISATAKLLLAQLIDHRNRRTAQCNPKVTTLAEELGIHRTTVIRGLAELKTVRYIDIKRGQSGNRYEFSEVATRYFPSRKSALGKSHSGTSGPPGPLYELDIRNLSAHSRAALPEKKSVSRASESLRVYYEKYAPKRKAQ